MELIDRYKLRGTKLPGYDYFKASKKERMLAAILATRSNERGHGLLTLCQQLEFMDAASATTTTGWTTWAWTSCTISARN